MRSYSCFGSLPLWPKVSCHLLKNSLSFHWSSCASYALLRITYFNVYGYAVRYTIRRCACEYYSNVFAVEIKATHEYGTRRCTAYSTKNNSGRVSEHIVLSDVHVKILIPWMPHWSGWLVHTCAKILYRNNGTKIYQAQANKSGCFCFGWQSNHGMNNLIRLSTSSSSRRLFYSMLW